MAKGTEFTVNGLSFRFVNSALGAEEIYVDDVLVSTTKALSSGKHQFVHEGREYRFRTVLPGPYDPHPTFTPE